MMVKLVHINSNYPVHVLGTSTATIFHSKNSNVILPMHLLPRMNVMLDFICMGPVDLPGAQRQNTK